MSEQVVYLTREGYEKLQAELQHLRTVRRREVARRLHDALTEGDLLENAELEAKVEQLVTRVADRVARDAVVADLRRRLEDVL